MTAAMHELLQRAPQGSGSNRGEGSNSISGILSTLVPVIVVAAISVALFIILRRKFGKVYYPRSEPTILPESEKRTPYQDGGVFGWIKGLKQLPDDLVLQRNSLDGYLFLRFFKVLIIITGVGCLITWPILFPVNATGHGGQSQLDILSFSNVANVNRYYAHVFTAWIFLGFVTLVIFHERLYFVGLRQAYFLSSVRAKRLPSRSVLFMGIPKEQRSVNAIRQALGPEVRNIWLVTDCKELEDLVEDRTKAHGKLEGAEVKLSKQANKLRLKAEKKGNADPQQPQGPQHWINDKKRPTHKLKPLIGKKVDTINWGREEVPRLNEEIRRQQARHLRGDADYVGAAFVEFTSQAAAQRAYQLAMHDSKKKQWNPRYIDVQPDEIVWKNLKESYATRKIKMALALAVVSAIILFWTPITAFVGALTNINYLTNKVPFLSFILDIPDVILGVVTGLLPTLVLALCVILFPILCRFLAKLAGEPTLSAIELKTQNWYMAFQVIQVFLITTFTSGAAAVATQIVTDPQTAPQLLAQNLPKASNFYISYFILYGLAQAASQLLNIVPLLLFLVLGKFLDSTPRKMYNRWVAMAGIGWGSEYPKWTNLGVIAIAYSCIAPLVLGFAVIGFTFLYIAFRYKWLFVLGNKVDMKGESYARALQHLMIGVYLSSVCLIGLFAIGTSKSAAGAGPLVLMIIFLVALVAFHVIMDYALGPLEQGLPLSLCSAETHDNHHHDETNGRLDGPPSIQHAESTDPHQSMDGKGSERQLHRRAASAGGGSSSSTPQTGNKLTQRLLPLIERRFFEPNRGRRYELPEVDYAPDEAYRNPAVTAEPPFTWLARDGCGVSRMLVDENRAAGLASTDELAWFDEKNRLHWDRERIEAVESMLEEKKS
ncbi:hypothetical protein F4778DRAFT_752225 [Xylariomycetidae sp. FL2044]|nr:hypothetical protein F4778DRAFT_752225 [Xylariomycetidae sp. FL2044]